MPEDNSVPQPAIGGETPGAAEAPQRLPVPQEQPHPQAPPVLQEQLSSQASLTPQEQPLPRAPPILQEQLPSQASPTPQEQPPPQEDLTAQKAPEKPKEKPPRRFGAFRITELPKNTTKKSLHEALQLLAQNGENAEDAICRLSVAPDQSDPDSYSIATVTFAVEPKALKKCSSGSDETLQLKIDGTTCSVQIDSQFTGMTTLHCYEPVVDIVAVQGLGGNGFGSWRATGNADMWLRDFLPEKAKNSRILIYGYNADLTGPGAKSFASILDMAKGLVNNLKLARNQPNEMQRPLILIGHSLGGLVLKQALVEAASNAAVSSAHKNIHDSFIGALFFGVPNRGLNDKFLHEIVKGQPNQNLIRSLDPESSELRMLHQGFTTVFDRKKYQFYSYYETRQTQLSRINQVTGRPEVTDEFAILVLESSATEAVPGQAWHNRIPVDGDHRSMTKFSKKTDQYFRQVSSDILSLVDVAQAMLEKQSLKTPTNFRSQDGHPTHFVVPYLKNEKYTPRSKLENILSKTSKLEKIVVLLGLGGTGKTQVALNLAFQSQHTRSVFWIDGYTVESSMSSLVSIGKQLGLAKAEMKEKDLCQALKKWLESDESGNWLIIVNNLTHTDSYTLDILSTEKGTLVVTTRQEDMARTLRANQLDCANMTADEARSTFHKLSGLDIDDKTLDEGDIISLIKALDYSPLAIALAASFIHETKTSIAEYIEIYQQSLPDHVKISQSQVLRFELKDLPTPPVMTAWDISFRRVKRDKPSAADLLQLMSMLDSHNVPVDLLYSKVTAEMGLEKGSKFEAAVEVLLSFSLLMMYKEHRYQVHDLIAAWTRKQMGDREGHFTKLSLSLIEEAFSDPNSPKLVDYLPHANAVLLHSGKVPKLAQQRIGFQCKLADILHQSGRHSEARDLIRDCIEYYEATKKDGMENAECAYQLALIEEANKDYDQAIMWCGKARDGFAQNLGQSHPRTLSTLTRIAMVSEIRGDYMNAIQNYEQALVWSKVTTADPFTIDIIHNMALVFDKQGRYDIAVEAYNQALHDSIQAVGEQHPYTLDIQNNIAISLRKQGRYDEALETFKRVSDAYAQILGKSDPSTLNVQGNIAVIDDIQGRHTIALQTYKWVLDLKEKSLGKTSPSTLSTLSNMALLLSKLGRHDEAVTAAQSALDGYQAALGDDNPATLDAVANCALVYDAAGDVPRAKEHYEHACWRKAMLLGLEHPSTLGTLAAFAALLVRLGSYEEALGLQTNVLRGYAVAFGPQHPFAVKAEYELAKMLEGLQRWEEARACLARVIEAFKGQDAQKDLAVVEQDLKNLDDRISGKTPVGFKKFGVGN